MSDKMNISTERKKVIIYLFLIVVTFAVYWQVNEFDFLHFDDNVYITQNSNIQSGYTTESIQWAFYYQVFRSVASSGLAIVHGGL